ncbi:flagellar motor switch protein FliM [Salinibacter altiplanensis]|uniref:flagellar motor switch protein FliM n=1 Tax=Salinibacter altiplanensis TaxID=1803181 RepID=UPI000C9F46EA|nr:flagellar motor switch protein FliM [Salinibacter altiplanensis]
MSKPLSQEEIDVLLGDAEAEEQDDSAGQAGDEQDAQAEKEKQAQPYNFKRPRLFSQTQKRILNQVHESFARDLSVYLSAQLRTIVDISLTAVDQVLYSEFVMSSAPPSALYVLREDELEYKSIFEIDPRLVVYTIEKLMGGDGQLMDESREVSPIEQRIMSRVMKRAYRKLEESWQKAYDLSVEEVAFESNAEFVQIIPAAEPALVASFDVRVYDEPSFINICYPYLMLEQMLGRSGMEQWISSSTTAVEPAVRNRYENTLRETQVDLSAELGRTVLPVTELAQLQEGDVIPLDRKTDDPVKVFVNDEQKFEAVPGRSGTKRALRITAVESPENVDFDSLTLSPDHDPEHAHDARTDGTESAGGAAGAAERG